MNKMKQVLQLLLLVSRKSDHQTTSELCMQASSSKRVVSKHVHSCPVYVERQEHEGQPYFHRVISLAVAVARTSSE